MPTTIKVDAQKLIRVCEAIAEKPRERQKQREADRLVEAEAMVERTNSQKWRQWLRIKPLTIDRAIKKIKQRDCPDIFEWTEEDTDEHFIWISEYMIKLAEASADGMVTLGLEDWDFVKDWWDK